MSQTKGGDEQVRIDGMKIKINQAVKCVAVSSASHKGMKLLAQNDISCLSSVAIHCCSANREITNHCSEKKNLPGFASESR